MDWQTATGSDIRKMALHQRIYQVTSIISLSEVGYSARCKDSGFVPVELAFSAESLRLERHSSPSGSDLLLALQSVMCNESDHGKNHTLNALEQDQIYKDASNCRKERRCHYLIGQECAPTNYYST